MPIHVHWHLFPILEMIQILIFCLKVLCSSDHPRLGLPPVWLVATQLNEVEGVVVGEGVENDDTDVHGLSQAKSSKFCPVCLDVCRPSTPEWTGCGQPDQASSLF